ncbi:sensor histidine kinase [Caulobacter sp.]|uniref:sensor histidine kinase n=1 Tax=Caulobacter sp. TaxID=78 RepID=UPI003BAE47A9
MIQQTTIHGHTANLPLHMVEEINHRVVNAYAEAISSLSLTAAQITAPEVQVALARAVDRLRAHAETHRALLQPMEGQVNLADYVGGLCASMSRASLAERSVYLTVETDEIWAGSARAWRIGLVVAELVRNAARHGLGGRSGAITVHLAQRGGEIFCGVRDNGGRPSNPRPGRGQGLVRALAAELGGSADWRFSDGGCVARLVVPIEAQAS